MTGKLWLFAVLALLSGFGISLYINSVSNTEENTAIQLYEIQLPDLHGSGQHFKQWQGKVLLVNFWATWCPPCREEIPVFLALREQFSAAGFEVVGISLDNVSKVLNYRDKMLIDYPLLDGEQKGMSLMGALGNRIGGLPYSVLFDRAGKAVHMKSGAYGQQELQALVEKYL